MDRFIVRNRTGQENARVISPAQSKKILRLLEKSEQEDRFRFAKKDLNHLLKKQYYKLDLISDPVRIGHITGYLKVLMDTLPLKDSLRQPMSGIMDLVNQKDPVWITLWRYRNPRPDEKFQCDNCNKGFKGVAALRTHVSVEHFGLRPFLCPFPGCGKKLVTANLLRTHSAVHDPNSPQFACNLCRVKSFRHQSTRNAHEKVCGNANKARYSCLTCSKNMSSQHNLKIHTATHDVEKAFECPVADCKKRFAQIGTLKKHAVVHTGEAKFQCEVCEKNCTQRYNLMEHMLTHTDEKEFKCDKCPSRFRRKQHLTRHMSTHTRVKCGICKVEFEGGQKLKLHNSRTHNQLQCPANQDEEQDKNDVVDAGCADVNDGGVDDAPTDGYDQEKNDDESEKKSSDSTCEGSAKRRTAKRGAMTKIDPKPTCTRGPPRYPGRERKRPDRYKPEAAQHNK